MQDRADYARRGIARGRSVVVLAYDGGILFVAENPSRALHKVSEIYDRIAFAAVGKYNEFENLRVAGVRYADLRGYSYDRSDVTARGLANAYAQTLGSVFTQESKPYEVEIVVAEVGSVPDRDQIYRLTYDGSVADEQGFVAMGGAAEPIATALSERWRADLTLGEALALAVEPARGRPGRGRPPRARAGAAWRSPCSTGTASGGCSAASRARCSSGCSARATRRPTSRTRTSTGRARTTCSAARTEAPTGASEAVTGVGHERVVQRLVQPGLQRAGEGVEPGVPQRRVG
ncbi:hypothetical protein GCM10025868_46180 [Angustibacter aerolatus]|uniref:Proteasome subunit alpha n=1 Tax=Angustibacter aerolatus TaxID=1162965 RepID=A0ABQ6JM85_9ACTN|nr:proteasome subunit alpha [Angustibacter aerolatus]GMA89368.1 hypothetical protein GCM10025868_46180 [Angustibacter aerolatus]